MFQQRPKFVGHSVAVTASSDAVNGDDADLFSTEVLFSPLQWYDALKAVARLPTGIPKEWRNRVCNLV